MSKIVAYPGRRRKKREVSSRFWLVVIPFFITMLAAIYLNSPFALVAGIEVQGNNLVSGSHITANSGIAAGDKIWRLNLGQTRDKLADPWFTLIQVRRVLPNTILIKVEERIPQALITTDQGMLLLSVDAVVLGPNELKLSLPWLTGLDLSEAVAGDDLSGNIAVAEAMTILYNFEEIVGNFSEINIDNRHAILYTSDGFRLLVDPANYLDKLDDVQVILNLFRRQGRTMELDLRTTGGKVITRPFN